MRLPSSVSNNPFNRIKDADFEFPRLIANLIFHLFSFSRARCVAHAHRLSYLHVCGDTAWYCCVHPGEYFQPNSFPSSVCVKRARVYLCEATAASVNRSTRASSQAHLTLDQLTPEQGLCPYISPHPDSTHTCARRHAHSATQPLALIGQKLVATKNALSWCEAVVF